MSEIVDGNSTWIGGMDTSRHPGDIDKTQYSKGINVIIPRSLGGMQVRPGFHNVSINFKTKEERRIYEQGGVYAEGWFEDQGSYYLVALVDGYVFRFLANSPFNIDGEIININSRNAWTKARGWCITLPNGCLINNGQDFPIYITGTSQRRLNPYKGDMPIGRMGVFLQNRLFMVDQSGRVILASDFMQPTRFTLEDTNIQGFMSPDDEEVITAIGRQQTLIDWSEGGNLIWSTNKNIYSSDVRGTRSSWGDLATRLGKTSQTMPGVSAVSSYSFENYNSNVYFRDKRFGLSDLRQSLYQFGNTDALTNQAVEASYFLENDTAWLLDWCYSRACNHRLLTTVAPEISDRGAVYWNGLLSFAVPTFYSNTGGMPRRFESVFTGVRPWCITSLNKINDKDMLYIHSYDKDGVNRIYVMNEDSNYDVDKNGVIKEIEGFIETRSYDYENKFLLKSNTRRIYRLNDTDRTIKICVASRPEGAGGWTGMWGRTHLICRNNIKDGHFFPINSKPQVRPFEAMSEEKFSACHKGRKFFSIQYRIEFTGPLNLDSLVLVGRADQHESTISKAETECKTLVYDYRPDYNYYL